MVLGGGEQNWLAAGDLLEGAAGGIVNYCRRFTANFNSICHYFAIVFFLILKVVFFAYEGHEERGQLIRSYTRNRSRIAGGTYMFWGFFRVSYRNCLPNDD